MAKKITEIDYDLDNDIFFMSNGENVKASLDIGDFVLDVNSNNLVCGIEIMNASENLGINKNILKSIKKIKMSVNYRTNSVYVLLMISFNKNSKEVNVQIPLSLNLGHKTPQKEVLIYN
ncbi:MAG: DUF2283 domain-containing protein [Nanoarchaeota archaeon]|nr:DUF2283 domain-containing protein [Nanoarchaeota archaeon]